MTEGKRFTPREALVGKVAVMKFHGGNLGLVFQEAQAWVAEREKTPDEPVKCPCCEKLVTLCLEHYQLRQPGHPCSQCREAEQAREVQSK